jgi:CPA1 family monovalent cation:H+ antiporter
MSISFVAILVIACGMALLAKRLKMPYTVLLVVAGLAMSLLLDGAPGLREHLEKIKLQPDLLLQLFLPILLFEAAFHVDLMSFLNNRRAILLLAIPGVIIGMVLTTAVFVPVATLIRGYMDWQTGLVIAAMLAATDPISVVALFKEFTVVKRLGIIIEGESLINDGVAVVLFGLVVKITADSLGLTLPILQGHTEEVKALQVLGDFLQEIFLGTAVGVAVGLAISYLTSKVNDHLIEVALTAIAAYGSNIAAIQLHASGVIAVVVCGMMIGNVGARHGMNPTTREAVFSFWEFAAFMANSFVFILIGLEIKLAGLWADAGLIAAFFCDHDPRERHHCFWDAQAGAARGFATEKTVAAGHHLVGRPGQPVDGAGHDAGGHRRQRRGNARTDPEHRLRRGAAFYPAARHHDRMAHETGGTHWGDS